MREDAEEVGLLLTTQKGGIGISWRQKSPDMSELPVEQSWAI